MIDVDFAAISNEQDQLTEMPEHKIVRVSKPYLEYRMTRKTVELDVRSLPSPPTSSQRLKTVTFSADG